MSSRRQFLLKGAQAIGLATLGGLVWSAHLSEAKSAPLTLRPPAALSEAEFLKRCIKCGICVESCPYDTLYLAKPGDEAPLGTPYFKPREIPCYMCTDIPCVPVCPTGALDVTKVTVDGSKDGELDINKSRMGLAVVDHESCIAFWGIQCDACYRACPLLDKAISLEYKRNERTGKHAFLIPVIHSEGCTGCGLCERACVTEKAAIFIRPHALVQGKVGSSYIKGWDSTAQEEVSDVVIEPTVTKRSEQSVEDYLNAGELFDD